MLNSPKRAKTDNPERAVTTALLKQSLPAVRFESAAQSLAVKLALLATPPNQVYWLDRCGDVCYTHPCCGNVTILAVTGWTPTILVFHTVQTHPCCGNVTPNECISVSSGAEQNWKLLRTPTVLVFYTVQNRLCCENVTRNVIAHRFQVVLGGTMGHVRGPTERAEARCPQKPGPIPLQKDHTPLTCCALQ